MSILYLPFMSTCRLFYLLCISILECSLRWLWKWNEPWMCIIPFKSHLGLSRHCPSLSLHPCPATAHAKQTTQQECNHHWQDEYGSEQVSVVLWNLWHNHLHIVGHQSIAYFCPAKCWECCKTCGHPQHPWPLIDPPKQIRIGCLCFLLSDLGGTVRGSPTMCLIHLRW